MVRVFSFLVGFGFCVLGFVYIISYLNLISLGYNFLEYVNFIIRRPECIMAFVGLIIIFLTIFIPKEDSNELYL